MAHCLISLPSSLRCLKGALCLAWHRRTPRCPHSRKQHVHPRGVQTACWEINPDSSLSLILHIQFLNGSVHSTSKHGLKRSACCHMSGDPWRCSWDVTPAPCVALTVTLYPVLSPLWAPDQLSLLRRTQREQAEKDFVVWAADITLGDGSFCKQSCFQTW